MSGAGPKDSRLTPQVYQAQVLRLIGADLGGTGRRSSGYSAQTLGMLSTDSRDIRHRS